MASSQPGLDARHRDRGGTIIKKHGNTLIATLREMYGDNFAKGASDAARLSSVLHRLDEASLSTLAKDNS